MNDTAMVETSQVVIHLVMTKRGHVLCGRPLTQHIEMARRGRPLAVSRGGRAVPARLCLRCSAARREFRR